MSSAFSVIDLSGLPAPDVIETLEYEDIVAEMLADFKSRGSYTAIVESDPAYKIIEAAAYREMLLRARVNDAARAVMLATAQKNDLTNIGANYHVERLVIDPGDPTAIPPIAPVEESDADYRARVQLSPEGYTTVGSEGSYIFQAKSADGDVKDAAAASPEPGDVTVYVLSRTGSGEAGPELLAKVSAALNAERVRPLTDSVTVQSAVIVPYEIEAELYVFDGPDAEAIRQNAESALEKYAADMHRIGYDVTLSGVLEALHQVGVQRAILSGATPTPDAEGRLVHVEEGEAAYCTSAVVTIAGTDV